MTRRSHVAAALVAAFVFPLVLLAVDTKPKTETDEHQARRVVAEAADHSLNSADDLLDLIAKSDRDRVEKDIKATDEKGYKAEGDKFQDAWMKKYGHRFSALSHVNELTGLKVTSTGTGTDEKIIVHLPAEASQKAYEIHLIREKSGWLRINLPDKVDGKTFKKNMMTSIEKLNSEFDKLPKDTNKAYERAITVLLHELAF